MNLIHKAIDPSYSAWISASAGTGKTKLLTDRIINLLLEEISPNTILCLTFTKAARSEMLSRINKTLQSFSTMQNDKLRERLTALLKYEASEKKLIFAKNLYSNYSKSRSKIKIYTIHGYCQSIIQRFPIESGLKPNCTVIDEIEATNIIKSILKKDSFAQEIPEIIKDSVSIFYIVDLIKDYIEFFYSNYQSDNNFDEEETHLILQDYFSRKIIKDTNSYEYDLKNYIKLLSPDLKSLDPIFSLLSEYATNAQYSILEENRILEYFLTKTLSPRKKIIQKNFILSDPDIEEKFLYIQDRIYNLKKTQEIQKAIKKNISLISMCNKVVKKYEDLKFEKGFLDYNDLIDVTYKLLCKKDIKEWIRYKLDETIDHILVDESQDTSELQWSIIKALADDFFSGQGYKDDKKRTIFVVGDLKQSIYSFQGARPDLFVETRNYIKKRATESGGKFIESSLDTTYRLPKVIFSFIHNVFIKTNFIEEVKNLECYHKERFSSVEIWPLENAQNSEDELFWPIASELSKKIDNRLVTAKKIAKYIKDILNSDLYIESKKRRVCESDFLVLVQKRSKLNKYLIHEMNELDINISGLDRVSISKNLSIRDIAALLKFIIDQKDDLNLAALLKSPYIGLNDEDLYKLRFEHPIIESLANIFPDSYKRIEEILLIYNNLNLIDFIFDVIYRYKIIEYFSELELKEEVDSLKVFMQTLYNLHQKDPTISIVEIIELLESEDFEIKRDLSGSEGVRIMTIHGSKGLEAPFVIIADANDIQISQKSPFINLIYKNNQIPIWHSQYPGNLFEEEKSHLKAFSYKEYLRLLYVALTRAQDHLVICGQGDENSNDNFLSWYDLCKNSASGYFEKNEEILKITDGTKKIAKNTDKEIYPQIKSSCFIDSPANQNLLFPEKIYFNFDSDQMKFGKIIHEILEFLPSPSSIEYKDFKKTLIEKYPEEVVNIIEQVEKNQFFNHLINLPNKREFEIATLLNNEFKVLRLDFAAFDDKNNEVIIVDYKTDKDKESFNLDYFRQLSEYKTAMQKIHPTKKTKAFLYYLRLNEFIEVN